MQRALLIISAAAVYAVNFWPSKHVTRAGLIALGNPEYAGFKGMFLPHLLLYSTLTAGVAALVWFTFVRARILPAPRLGPPTARQLGAGVVGGIVALIATAGRDRQLRDVGLYARPIPAFTASAYHGVGVYFSWLMRKAQSLWTPYASHMVLDIVGDSLIG